ncbi:hypothetical protein QEH68_18360 [Paenarthrobacter sp. OM7]|uniref:Uncharacterized protein n=1 Tax=Paenarthrobacter sp. AMU7 TaxID=3162492 RepID=A0AB39YPQ8_9MICC|nr:hypothetical protein [Paenarthrobacter sp. OM7]WGM19964.1 hypothetical protein QEH68_18360 [Paenarthrobacter sp. OM7]
MELFDTHTVVISAVLLVHSIGVVLLVFSAAVLMTLSFTVVLAVQAVRTTWAHARNTLS